MGLPRAYRFIAFWLLVLVTGSGCQKPESTAGTFYAASQATFRTSAGEQEAVLRRLRDLDLEPFRDAFAALNILPHSRYTRTVQLSLAGDRVAAVERVVRFLGEGTDRPPEVLYMDTTGAFDFGFLDAFVSREVEAGDLSDLAQYLLPDEPPYLAPRNRDAFTFEQLPDTLLGSIPVSVYEVVADPEFGENQNVRRARFYVRTGSDTLVAFTVERLEKGMLFREESRFFAQLRPAHGNAWVPYLTRFSTRLKVPLRERQWFHSLSVFYAYELP